MVVDPRGDKPGDVATPGATRTIDHFARTLGTHLPRRLKQLRELGRSTRAIGRDKPPTKGR